MTEDSYVCRPEPACIVSTLLTHTTDSLKTHFISGRGQDRSSDYVSSLRKFKNLKELTIKYDILLGYEALPQQYRIGDMLPLTIRRLTLNDYEYNTLDIILQFHEIIEKRRIGFFLVHLYRILLIGPIGFTSQDRKKLEKNCRRQRADSYISQ